jgi:hypothetical protein
MPGEGGRMVLHIIPFTAFGSESILDPRRVHGQELTPIWCSGFHSGYNVGGYWTIGSGDDALLFEKSHECGVEIWMPRIGCRRSCRCRVSGLFQVTVQSEHRCRQHLDSGRSAPSTGLAAAPVAGLR